MTPSPKMDDNGLKLTPQQIKDFYFCHATKFAGGGLELFRMVRDLALRKTSQEGKGCPCTVEGIEPCRSSCSCANPIMSGGCDRCARYGSKEQRLKAAQNLVERLSHPASRSEMLETEMLVRRLASLEVTESEVEQDSKYGPRTIFEKGGTITVGDVLMARRLLLASRTSGAGAGTEQKAGPDISWIARAEHEPEHAGPLRCPKHGGYGFSSDCAECNKIKPEGVA